MKHGHRHTPGTVQSWARSQLGRRARTPGYCTVQVGEEDVGKRWAGRDTPPHLHRHEGGHHEEVPRHATCHRMTPGSRSLMTTQPTTDPAQIPTTMLCCPAPTLKSKLWLLLSQVSEE